MTEVFNSIDGITQSDMWFSIYTCLIFPDECNLGYGENISVDLMILKYFNLLFNHVESFS